MFGFVGEQCGLKRLLPPCSRLEMLWALVKEEALVLIHGHASRKSVLVFLGVPWEHLCTMVTSRLTIRFFQPLITKWTTQTRRGDHNCTGVAVRRGYRYYSCALCCYSTIRVSLDSNQSSTLDTTHYTHFMGSGENTWFTALIKLSSGSLHFSHHKRDEYWEKSLCSQLKRIREK